jgi:hypothetical protein
MEVNPIAGRLQSESGKYSSHFLLAGKFLHTGVPAIRQIDIVVIMMATESIQTRWNIFSLACIDEAAGFTEGANL